MAISQPRQRSRLQPAEFYTAERVITLGEVDTSIDPKFWKGWDDHWLCPYEKTKQGQTAIFGALRTYKGRIFLWYEVRNDPYSRFWYTVIRWDQKTEKHLFIGHYKNYADAYLSLGLRLQYKWLQVAPDKFVLRKC